MFEASEQFAKELSLSGLELLVDPWPTLALEELGTA
jgi:hypothetical protein